VHDKQVRRRRAVLGLLVGLSLILLTAYFGESPSSPLHSVQRGIVEVISPVQAGASTVLSPVKDVAGWFSDTFSAKGQRDRLRREVASLTKQADAYHQQALLAQQYARQLGLDQSNSLSSYRPVVASVQGRDASLWYQTVTVNKGSADGVSMNDTVTGDGFLVGRVTTVDPNASIVTLITAPSYAVVAEVLGGGGNNGILVPAVGTPGEMFLQNLPPHATIQAQDQVITAGFTVPSNPKLAALDPPGLPIGHVSDANQNELLNNHQVTVVPGADLRHLSVVQILTAPHAGTARAQGGSGG